MKSIHFAAPVALLLVGTAPLLAAPADGPNPIFTGSDLFDIEVATDPQISPDGRTIAYVRQTTDIMTDKARPTIWLVDVASGQQRPLVAGNGSYSSPRWSPSGDRLAYVAAEGGGPQLHVRWIASGESARITGLPDSPDSIAWSPDGRRIAYAMFVPDDGPRLGSAPPRPEGAKWAEPLQIIDAVTYRADGAGYFKPGFNQLFWVPADGGAPTQFTFGATNAGGPISWTADGRSVLFGANLSKNWQRDLNEAEIYRVSIDGGAPAQLTNRKGPDFAPTVSPNGRLIAYLSADERGLYYNAPRLRVMNADGSGDRRVPGVDEGLESIVWAPDSSALYATYPQAGKNRVTRIALNGSTRLVADGLSGGGLDRPYSGGEFSVSRGNRVAVTVGNASRPADIGIAEANGSIRRLTNLNADLQSKALGQVRKLPVTSSYDQRPIDAWLVTPPGFDPAKRYPMILEIHGGPQTAYGDNFSTDVQLYAAAGYVVVYSNPRGSTSYGEEFANLIDKDYPGHDYDDLMSTVDAAVATGFVDPANLFITGGSGGGVLTAWSIGKTDRFRAAAVQKPVIELASFALTTDFAAGFAPAWRKQWPWEDPEGYWKYSPLSLVGNVKTPTLVVVGSEDHRTPASQAEQLYLALQVRGIPTAYIKVPGAGHSITARPSQSAAKASAIIDWFNRYKSGAAPAQ
jgi:dipeptidyl aminopeptidase/acylaminoacyl peptidase